MSPLSEGAKGHEATSLYPGNPPPWGCGPTLTMASSRAPILKSEKSGSESLFLHLLAVKLRQTGNPLLVPVIITLY